MISIDKYHVILWVICMISLWLGFTIVFFKCIMVISENRKLKDDKEDSIDKAISQSCKCSKKSYFIEEDSNNKDYYPNLIIKK